MREKTLKISILVMLFFIGCIDSGGKKESAILSINAHDDSEELIDYLSKTYDCKIEDEFVKCNGRVQYIGDPKYEVSGARVSLYVYQKTEGAGECTVGDDSQNLGTMGIGNSRDYSLTVKIDKPKDVYVKIGNHIGVAIYPSECQ